MPKFTLAEARALAGLTLSQLAQQSRTPVSTVADLERGGNQNPGFALVMRLVLALREAGLRALQPEDIFSVSGAQLRDGGLEQADE